MGRIAIAAILFFLRGSLRRWSQSQIDQQLKEAGVCARCHVLSVMEWGMSGSPEGGDRLVSLAMASSVGHVKDERDNVKPDHIPHGVAIAGLCATCHTAGCPQTKKTADCQTCHHVHALIDPNKQPPYKDERAGATQAEMAVLRPSRGRRRAARQGGAVGESPERIPGRSAGTAGQPGCGRALEESASAACSPECRVSRS